MRRARSTSPEAAPLEPRPALQVRVRRMLGLGFALSVSWAGGVGSLAALVIGFRARKMIKQAGGEVVGMKMAWWCIVAGAVGTATVLPYVVRLIIKAVNT